MAYRKVKVMSDVEAAYLAGIIDGEGTVTLSKHRKGAKRQLAITISSTEISILDWVKSAVGVGVTTKKGHYRKDTLYHLRTMYIAGRLFRSLVRLSDTCSLTKESEQG